MEQQATPPSIVPRAASTNESSSKTVIETIDGSHVYTIQRYSLAKGMGPGKYISSDVFTVGGYGWAIYFFPDGISPDDKSMYVSAYVGLASKGKNVKALYGLTLLDQSGKGKHKAGGNFDRTPQSGPLTFKYRRNMWGFKQYFKRSELETSDYIKEDCLVFRCTIGVVMRRRNERPKKFSISVPPSNNGHCIKGFFESGIASDIVFEVDGQIFKAHKQILADRSPVFQAQFFGPIGNPNIEKVILEEIAPPVFKAVLHFIYYDSLPDLHELGSITSCSSAILVQHLLAAADRYGLDRLKLLCEAKLCEEVTANTVATTLAIAEQYNCYQLKCICLKFAALHTNLEVVMRSEGYGHLKESFPTLLSELLQVVATNGSLLCRKHSKRNNVAVNLRNALSNLKLKISFK